MQENAEQLRMTLARSFGADTVYLTAGGDDRKLEPFTVVLSIVGGMFVTIGTAVLTGAAEKFGEHLMTEALEKRKATSVAVRDDDQEQLKEMQVIQEELQKLRAHVSKLEFEQLVRQYGQPAAHKALIDCSMPARKAAQQEEKLLKAIVDHTESSISVNR